MVTIKKRILTLLTKIRYAPLAGLKTPNIDRLAKEGTDFASFTVASGVCSPSRTAMTEHSTARYNIDVGSLINVVGLPASAFELEAPQQ